MKALIFTGAFGMGHYSAAEAVKEEILREEPEATVIIIDMIEYIFPKFSELIYLIFNFMVNKFSLIYNFFNKIVAKRTSVPLKKSVMKKIDLLLKNNDVDLVISTFPACSQYFSAYKKMRNCNIPLYTYVTDISVNEEWISEQTDLYFVGSDITKNSLLCKNVDSDKIVISGIPVKQNFKVEKTIEKSKDKKEVLIMGGGLGLIPCAMDFLEKLSKDDNIKITFIAGKNKKLLEHVKEKYPNVESIGYTDKVDQYMKKADLIISKSGGITLFEAIFSGTPLYVIRPFLYQEIGNALYIQDSFIGKVIWTNGTDIYEDVTSLLNNELLLKSMKENIVIEKEKLQSTSPLNYYYGGITACY